MNSRGSPPLRPAQILARAAATVEYDLLPKDVVERARLLIIDTLAAIAGGLADPEYSEFVMSSAIEPGQCTIPGHPFGVPMATALQVNCGATTVLQIQDGHRVARGHPASAIIPGLIALAERDDLDGLAVIAALVAGYEACVRVGIAMGGLLDALHDAGNWGTIGAAVATLHLMGCRDPEIYTHAIESAATIALFPWSRTVTGGATSHHLFMGIGATTGYQAAIGALAGMTGEPGALEQFLLPRAGKAPDPSALTRNIDPAKGFTEFELLTGYFKWHTVCAHWSTTADAMAALVAQHGPLHDRAKSVEVAIYSYALHYNVADPSSDLAARFSGQAVVAAMLENGVIAKDGLSAKVRATPEFQERMSRVTVVNDPALDAGYPAGRPVRITVTLGDGSTLVQENSAPRGDGAAGLTRAEVVEKAKELFSWQVADSDATIAALEAYLSGEKIWPAIATLRQTKR